MQDPRLVAYRGGRGRDVCWQAGGRIPILLPTGDDVHVSRLKPGATCFAWAAHFPSSLDTHAQNVLCVLAYAMVSRPIVGAISGSHAMENALSRFVRCGSVKHQFVQLHDRGDCSKVSAFYACMKTRLTSLHSDPSVPDASSVMGTTQYTMRYCRSQPPSQTLGQPPSDYTVAVHERGTTTVVVY